MRRRTSVCRALVVLVLHGVFSSFCFGWTPLSLTLGSKKKVAFVVPWYQVHGPNDARCDQTRRPGLKSPSPSSFSTKYPSDLSSTKDDKESHPSMVTISSALTSYGTTSIANSTPTIAYDEAPTIWEQRIQQLIDYKALYGDTLVPKRYPENPALGNWVNKQRQQYRQYCNHRKPCSLTERRIQMLNELDFCWDATATMTATTTRGTLPSAACHQDETKRNPKASLTSPSYSLSSHRRAIQKRREVAWWNRFHELQHQLAATYPTTSLSNSSSLLDQIPSQSSLGYWITQQRKDYKRWKQWNDATCLPPAPCPPEPHFLDESKIEALNAIDKDWWKGYRERQWEARYQELIEYRRVHGDCCVPISYPNKKLANWVSNQRRKYSWKRTGKRSEMTDEEVDLLNKIGFVWNRWDYEFEKKL